MFTGAMGLLIFQQPLLVGQILFPGDVAGVSLALEKAPLVTRQLQPLLDLGLDVENHLQSQGCDALNQCLADSLINPATGDSLTHRLRLVNTAPLANVVRG